MLNKLMNRLVGEVLGPTADFGAHLSLNTAINMFFAPPEYMLEDNRYNKEQTALSLKN